jgi:formylglycine-generating enzyme required for sulfatase activity
MSSQPLGYLTFTVKDVTSRLINIPAGGFMMGSDKYPDEQPIRPVQLPAFWLAEYPCTQALYQAVTGQNPSYFKGKNRPVEGVSWDGITDDFLPRLRKLTGQLFRLPSEAEWEYAAKAGGNSKYAGGDDLHRVGWYNENSHRETKPVGLKMPNAWGLYDMSGNVWEWCEDDWHDNYKSAPNDGRARIDEPRDAHRVFRGGGWGNHALSCRAAFRSLDGSRYQDDSLGFRLALPQLKGRTTGKGQPTGQKTN